MPGLKLCVVIHCPSPLLRYPALHMLRRQAWQYFAQTVPAAVGRSVAVVVAVRSSQDDIPHSAYFSLRSPPNGSIGSLLQYLLRQARPIRCCVIVSHEFRQIYTSVFPHIGHGLLNGCPRRYGQEALRELVVRHRREVLTATEIFGNFAPALSGFSINPTTPPPISDAISPKLLPVDTLSGRSIPIITSDADCRHEPTS